MIDIKQENKTNHRAYKYLNELDRKSIQEKLEDSEQSIYEELKSIYPLFGLKSALKVLSNTKNQPSEEQLSTPVKFIDRFSTVSLHPAIIGEEVSKIACEVNQYKHTKTCRKYLTTWRFNFPKLPAYETVIAKPAPESVTQEDKKNLEKKYFETLKKVRECLKKIEIIAEILETHPKHLEKTYAEAVKGRRQRINLLLNRAGLHTDEDKTLYQQALEYSSAGYAIILARDVDEIWVNSYNPEITRAWNGNTDFQIVLDFYAIITYIFEYFTKDDSGVMQVLVNTLKLTENKDLKDQMISLMNAWIKSRQMGEAEAVFRLIPHFKFRQSDSKCVFVQTCSRSEKSKILKNATDKPEYRNHPKVYVYKDNREYVEQYDLHSKYERRPMEQFPLLKHQLCTIYQNV